MCVTESLSESIKRSNNLILLHNRHVSNGNINSTDLLRTHGNVIKVLCLQFPNRPILLNVDDGTKKRGNCTVAHPAVQRPSHCLSYRDKQRRAHADMTMYNLIHQNSTVCTAHWLVMTIRNTINHIPEHLPLPCLLQDLKLRSSEPQRQDVK